MKHAHGREAVRSYWTRQWAELDSWVEPVTIATRSEAGSLLTFTKGARNLAGEVPGRVLHVYELRDGLVARMDVEEPTAAN